jgi:acyl-CoA dehydrogenase
MIDFTLTEQQRNIRELAHDFAQKEIRPVAWEYDRDATWPQEIIRKAWAVGLMNSQLPERYGGAGASYLDGVLIGEELAWGCAAIGTTLGINELAAAPVRLGGSNTIKSLYLGMLTEELKLASFCPDGARRRLRRVGDAHHRRTQGRQVRHQRVEGVHQQRRLRRLVHGVRQDRQGRGAPRHLGVPGPARRHRHGRQARGQDGAAGVDTAAISFNGDRGAGGEPVGRGEPRLQARHDDARPHAAGPTAMATGIARAAFEFATEYAKQRVQFGVRIAMHQAIQFMIADMATEIEAARLLAWQSAVLLDQGKRNTVQSSHAKRFAADAAMRAATDAVQIYGGYGFIKDYPVEKLMRDAKIMQLYEGTSRSNGS